MSARAAELEVYVGSDTKDAERGIRHLGTMIQGWARHIGASITDGPLEALGMKLVGVAKGFIMANANAETMRMQLEISTGSIERAGELFQWLQKTAAATPFEFPELMQSANLLEGFGIDAQKYLITLGNVAAGTGKTLEQVTQAFLDASTGEFERLKELGIKARTEGDKVVFSYMQNGKEMTASADKTSASMIQSTLQGIWNSRFDGAMDKQSKTFKGMLSTMMDNINLFAQGASKGLFNFLKGGLAGVNKFFSIFGTLKERGVDPLHAAFLALRRVIAPHKNGEKTWADFLMTIEKVIRASLHFAGVFFGKVGAAVRWVINHFNTFKPLIMGVAGAFVFLAAKATLLATVASSINMVRTALMFLTGPLGILIGLTTLFFTAYQKNWFGVRDITSSVLGTVLPWFSKLGTALSVLGGYLKAVFSDGDYSNDFLASMPGWLKGPVKAIGQFIAVGKAFAGVLGAMFGTQRNADGKNAIEGRIKALGPLLERVFGKERAEAFQKALRGIAKPVRAIGHMFQSVGKFVSSFFKVLSGKNVAKNVRNLQRQLGNIFGKGGAKSIIDGAKSIITSLKSFGSSINDVLNNLFNIKNGAGLLTTLITIFGKAMSFIKGTVLPVLGVVLGGALKTLAAVIGVVAAVLRGDWSGAWKTATDFVKQNFLPLLAKLPGLLSTVVSGLKGVAKEAFNLALDTAVELSGWLWKHKDDVWGGIKTIIGWGAGKFSDAISATIDGTLSFAGDLFDAQGKLWSWVKGKLYGTTPDATGGPDALGQKSIPLGTVLVDGLLALGTYLYNISVDFAKWLWGVLKGAWDGALKLGAITIDALVALGPTLSNLASDFAGWMTAALNWTEEKTIHVAKLIIYTDGEIHDNSGDDEKPGKSFVQRVLDGAYSATTAVLKAGDWLIHTLARGIGQGVGAAMGLVVIGVGAIIYGLYKAITNPMSVLRLVNAMGELLSKAIIGSLKWVAGLVITMWKGWADGFMAVIPDNVVTAIKTSLQTAIDKVTDWGLMLLSAGVSVITGLSDGMAAAWYLIVTSISGAVAWILSQFYSAVQWLKTAGEDIIKGLDIGMNAAWHLVVTAITGVVTWIPDQFANAKDWLLQAGKDIIQGLIDGATETIPGLETVVNTVLNLLDQIPGMGNSPWPTMIAAGKDAMNGLIIGAESRMSRLGATVTDAIDAMMQPTTRVSAKWAERAMHGVIDAMTAVSSSTGAVPAMAAVPASARAYGSTVQHDYHYDFKGAIVGDDAEDWIGRVGLEKSVPALVDAVNDRHAALGQRFKWGQK